MNNPASHSYRYYALLSLVVVLALWALVVILLTLAIYLYGRMDEARPADVIIVLGAGLRPDNRPGPALTRRTLHAANLYREGVAPHIICSGGVTGRATRTEAAVCEDLLLGWQIPQEAIIRDDESRSTEENAIYSRAIMTANQWQTAVIVSDNYHMLRARAIFDLYGVRVHTSPVAMHGRQWEYVVAVFRETAAFHWLFIKNLLNLPQTYVAGL